ncbi:MAG: hypothetical protein K2Y22_08845 [Candidatus Obscuribacterales bacterium]|nr:hypothetical protein [Candidatus Obscuribacterales bacterium]
MKLATVLVFAGLVLCPSMPASMSQNAGSAAAAEDTKVTSAKVGKKPKKAGSSERISDNANSTSVQLRLSGSLCVGCLVELERKLKLMPGMVRVKVDIPGTSSFDSYSGPGASGIITATMSYDSSKISMEQLEDFIRTQGYTVRRVIER